MLPVTVLMILLFEGCRPSPPVPAQLVHSLEPGEIPSGSVAFVIDAQSSEIIWTGTRVNGRHFGTIGISQGDVFVHEGSLVGGSAFIDMEQLVVLDITDPDRNRRLTSHLKSADFFHVDSFPMASFRFLLFEELEWPDEAGNNYKITGNLTIKEITHTIAFNALILKQEGQVQAMADFNLDRTLWDIRFRSGRFFENLGDNLIHDHFNLKLNVLAKMPGELQQK